jgi:outer membrane protein assembly factor BamB/3',5'-cyclic AMP phosphodiesterase CpdA
MRSKLWLLIIVLLCAGWRVSAQGNVPDFSFIHCSDVHVPAGKESAATVAQMRDVKEVKLAPYGVTAPPPSFAIVTGDLTEFGGGKEWWQQYLDLWKDFPFPIFHISGNHDATWDCLRDRIRQLHGNAFYSFDRNGCHFIALDTATPQDPRPSVPQEFLVWLQEDLKKVTPETPIFVFCHHPLGGSEFASKYDSDRLLDMLRPYNVAAFLVGHGHSARYMDMDGIDAVMGGSTFGPAPGYSVISIQGGVLRVAYKRDSETEATKGLLEKPLPKRSDYPTISIFSPQERSLHNTYTLAIHAEIQNPKSKIQNAEWMIDDDKNLRGALQPVGATWQGDAQIQTLTPGAHYWRVSFTDEAKKVYHKSAIFYFERVGAKAKWRAFLSGSSKSTPTVANGTVYVGANDGKLYALDANDGKVRWAFQTGGEVLCQPLVENGTVCFGSGDGKFYALDTNGKVKWTMDIGAPVFSSPVFSDGLILFGCNSGKFYALDAATGAVWWVNGEPQYTIESKPFVSNGVVYFGAWDMFAYAVNVKDGSLKWKCVGAGSATVKGAHRYFSPADCGPVVVGNRVFIADRNYQCAVIDAQTGERMKMLDKISGVGVSQDGQFVYLRKTDGDLVKADADGNELWKAPTQMGYVAASTTEQNGVVYVSSGLGLVSAVSASDGKILWQYQATPQLYVFSTATADNGVVFVSGMDGSVTAIGSIVQ